MGKWVESRGPSSTEKPGHLAACRDEIEGNFTAAGGSGRDEGIL